MKAYRVSRVAWLVTALLVASAGNGTLSGAEPKPKSPQAAEQEIQAHNAARTDKGGRVSLQLLGPDTGQDKRNQPDDSTDGDVHTRCVVWGVPYAFRIELVDKLPVTEVNFICSDYATEESPKDIELRLPDGTVIKQTLEKIVPKDRRDKPRQALKIGKDLDWLEVKVLSSHPGGPNPQTGKPVSWGGIGEIEVITSADLAPYLQVPNDNPDAPVYAQGGSPKSDYSAVKVTLPPPIPLGEHPGIYLTRDDIVTMRRHLAANERAKPMLEKLTKACDEWLDKKIEHPDPNVPAQMRDRSDAQAKAHSMLSKMAGWLGWAYQLTDNERYAEKAREILVGYAKLYPNDYKEHKGVHDSDTSKVMAQRLSEAMWLLPLIQAYDMVYHAKCMTDDDRRLIENDLFRCAVTFINGKRSAAEEVSARQKANANWRTADPEATKGPVGNWVNFYNAAFIQAGIVLKDQDWIDVGAASTKFMIARGIGEDGMWKEGAIGYQLFARQALVACLEPLARRGYDLYAYQQCRVKNLWDSPLKYAYPDGTAPGIHDSGRVQVASDWTAMAYDFAWLRYQDRNYGGIVNAAERQVFQSEGCYFPTVIYQPLPAGEIASMGSVIFDTLGYAILRGGDAGRQTFLLMDYGPHGGGHGHPDKLNLILFADGDELAGEPQVYRYEDNRHAEWTRPTIAHWTVSVDLHEQAPTAGKLLVFYDAGNVKVMRGVSTGAYAGVGLDRTVVQMPGYVADVYRAWSNASRTYDYPLCFRGALDAMQGVDATRLKPLGLPTCRGYKHILVREPLTTDKDWSGVWRRDAAPPNPDAAEDDAKTGHPANRVQVTVLGEPQTAIHIGQNVDQRHQVVVRRQGKETVFAAVVNPYKDRDVVKSVGKLAVTGPVPAYGLRIGRDDGSADLIIVRYDPQKGGRPAEPSAFDGGKTDALISIARLDAKGAVTRLGMLGGTRFSFADQALTLDTPGIQWSK
ncbi:MAG: heparinase II/III family protein [Planctomycetota bacterium]|nr:heparinase II/III family protein [Planctomycetota bacterium]